MKKLLLLVFLISTIALRLGATGADLFQVNEDQIKSEMSELNLLEQFVLQNDGVTFTQLEAEHSELITNVTADQSTISNALSINSPMGALPAFLWGFCLGPIGVLIAYLIDEDNLMWSGIGCLVSGFFYGGGWLFLQ